MCAEMAVWAGAAVLLVRVGQLRPASVVFFGTLRHLSHPRFSKLVFDQMATAGVNIPSSSGSRLTSTAAEPRQAIKREVSTLLSRLTHPDTLRGAVLRIIGMYHLIYGLLTTFGFLTDTLIGEPNKQSVRYVTRRGTRTQRSGLTLLFHICLVTDRLIAEIGIMQTVGAILHFVVAGAPSATQRKFSLVWLIYAVYSLTRLFEQFFELSLLSVLPLVYAYQQRPAMVQSIVGNALISIAYAYIVISSPSQRATPVGRHPDVVPEKSFVPPSHEEGER